MADETTDRARWLAIHVMPWEIESRGWLRRVVPPGLEVDDVIQEAYAILASLADVSRIVNPKAYFYQVIKSLISEYLRRASVATGGLARRADALPEPQEGLTPERIVSGRQALESLQRAIVRLPEPSRTIFVMRKIDNLPQKVIAERLRVSENTVEKQIARGLRIILLQLKSEDEAGRTGRAPISGQRKDH
jgi:RNA polymerase sigma-70 factor (ECF subfamily)